MWLMHGLQKELQQQKQQGIFSYKNLLYKYLLINTIILKDSLIHKLIAYNTLFINIFSYSLKLKKLKFQSIQRNFNLKKLTILNKTPLKSLYSIYGVINQYTCIIQYINLVISSKVDMFRSNLWFALILALVGLSLQVTYELNSANFQSMVGCSSENYVGCEKNTHRDWFIMFHAPWCGHCKNSKPTFTEFASKYGSQLGDSDNQLTFGFVDCTTDQNICRYFGVNGFPVFLYLSSDHQNAFQFNGGRTFENFQKFIQNPSQSSFSKAHEIGFTIMDEIIKIVKPYWKEAVLFGLILPAILGYLAAQFMTKWENNKKKKLAQQKLRQLREKNQQANQQEEQPLAEKPSDKND